MCLYIYVLRRLWVEWEVFIKLRYGYLMNGDGSFDQRPTYMRKFRNSVMVECVPPGYRSDQNLRDVFENLFPGRIRHAEMLIDTTKLEGLLERRRGFIDKYDDANARFEYEKWRYGRQQADGGGKGCCGRQLVEPQEPKVGNASWGGSRASSRNVCLNLTIPSVSRCEGGPAARGASRSRPSNTTARG